MYCFMQHNPKFEQFASAKGTLIALRILLYNEPLDAMSLS